MSEQQNPSEPSTTNTFTGGLVKDPIDLYKKSDTYVHARNMTNNLLDGGVGGKSGEPSNINSANIPYTLIGAIYLSDDQWLLFSTDNTHSEIGMFIDTTNTYSTIMNDTATIAAGLPGLNFNTSNLITGTARRGFDCGYDTYWSDGRRNPDRMLDTAFLNPNPWVQNCTTSSGCITCVNTNKINVEQLRLAPIYSTPCLKLSKHTGSGQLPNGSYQVCIGYAANSIRCTDYIAFSDVYSVFTHVNNGGSIALSISNIDDDTKLRFTEMEVVLISMVNSQVQAKLLGIYSTNQGIIVIDNLDKSAENIPIDRLPISNPAIVSSDAIFGISNYLTRLGPSMRPDFNYQLIANNIIAKWVAVQYDEAYYHKGGDQFAMNVGYLRGEVYAFFIRWIYSTGDKSASYVIPGRPGGSAATIAPAATNPASSDTGIVLASGLMAGYSSTEIYPDNQLSVWGPLCGQPIRWHKFPDQASFGGTILSHFNPVKSGTISVMGVTFENIKPPVDNTGAVIPDIVGYEILRAVRDGNESIVAKGMVNNMRTYNSYPGSPVDGLFQNYPYNDLSADGYLTGNVGNINSGTVGNGSNSPLSGYREDILSFHSPDTVFNHPYLGAGQLQVVMALTGLSKGKFTQPYKHPMFKVLSDFDSYISDIIGALVVLTTLLNILSGGGSNIQLAATESIPFETPLGLDAYPDGTFGALGEVIYAGMVAANVILAVLLAPLQFLIIQEQMLTVIKGLIPARQFALQYNSFGYYNLPVPTGRILSTISDYQYIKGEMQSFAGFTINNLYRNDYVALQLQSAIPAYPGDNSRYTSGGNAPTLNVWDNTHKIASYYAAYTVSRSAQYGQIDSTKQVPVGCVQLVTTKAGITFPKTPILFGGDTYINRYTEKNPFFFFNDWLVNAPEDFKYDYRNYINVPYPMFWIDNDVVTYDLLAAAHQNRRLDGPVNLKLFYVDKGYFYLFNNGIRDFFVESSVNVGYRDWEDETAKRFYDPYGSSDDFINDLFRADIIKSNILYKYDYSLSSNRFINQYISWSKCLRRDYDPNLAYTCFAYYPRRLAYSLPQEEEQMKDNWRLFLPNNYKNFDDNVNVVKDLHKTGALFLLESSSPYMFAGTEAIASKSNTEYTVGTGKLFDQSLQSISNADGSYEYASCQSRLGVVNTPHGVFWASQNNGRIFCLRSGQLIDIGQEAGLKFHLLQYLPSKIAQQFPAFQNTDNPVSGVGVQLIYDSVNEILYISKKDYSVIGYTGGIATTCKVTYSGGNWYWTCLGAGTTISTKINFGDPNYFYDASWTLSYDCKTKQFVSFHDWHPSYNIPSKNRFFTTNGLSGRLWRHNDTAQSFCNFYGKNYPLEIEYYTNTQATDTLLQSVEWLLESYQYAPNGTDKFLNYDESFDQIMISNREQNSTLQQMLLKPWNNPYAALAYPQFIGPVRNILYQKVENKYRVNDFYDYTNDRGQFSLASTPMVSTDQNGYTFTTNAPYFNILKPWNQLKRFRYLGTRIFLRKTTLGKNSLTLRYATTRNQYSPR